MAKAGPSSRESKRCTFTNVSQDLNFCRNRTLPFNGPDQHATSLVSGCGRLPAPSQYSSKHISP